jgi:hypothetical protein
VLFVRLRAGGESAKPSEVVAALTRDGGAHASRARFARTALWASLAAPEPADPIDPFDLPALRALCLAKRRARAGEAAPSAEEAAPCE